ncbi:PAS domain S-box-containing protein/diguanylate cyclase (GGDEF) domain-containing protein [Pseudomonas cuatrocienegasensis]|uniref:PAS domain S-box-containing protein/diguanylate cyclase (GGDEF) domain-containing protein n=1 Tax=Pseudomonas cuatrocienegasensis TaxID=543360 RepID=A0ABY1B6C0_9PSED|nr:MULTISPECIES: EAL domain-containing protein [Pseudomonas]OEC36790.1 diguanylate cyclase [Pseudomonas sp. 21C1]SEQ06703.1 PAS domain S-box-containing protein/diguanylate cyclase (GGDEF) domain-containing protein [Pseudomonas cuatrocienegasensis]
MPAAPALPRWTWWLPLPLFHLATWLALASQFADGAALLYVPFALALVLCLWWGPRVLPAMYLNALLSIPLWGLDWQWAPLYAIPETVGVGLAWLLLRRRPFDAALADLPGLLRFCALGVFVPVVLVSVGVQGNLWLTGHLPTEDLLVGISTLILADSLISLALATPLLVYVTPWMRRCGWVLQPGITALPVALRRAPPWYLLLALMVGLPWLLGWLPLTLNLPLLGVVMLALALVWGMAGALCGALLSVLLVLVLPLVVGASEAAAWLDPQRLEMHLSVLLFMLASLLIGRSLSDLRQALQHSAQVQQQLTLAHLALDASPLGVSIADARTSGLPVIYSNPALARITGYGREESLGSDSLTRLQDERPESELPRLQQAIHRGEPCQVVLRNQRKDGRAFWNELILAPLHDGEGVSHFVALQNDVTAREELAEQVARQRRELLRQSHLFSQTEHIASLGGWMLDVADLSMYWSLGCFRIYELDPKGAAPSLNQALDYLDANGRVLAQQVSQRLQDGRDQFDIEVRLITARGRSRWVRIRGVAERDGEALVRVYGAVQDVSSRRRTEQQLRERDERLRLFFEAPLLGMALTSPSYGWEEVNAKLCSILGRTTEQLLASSWEELSQPDDWLVEQRLLDDVLAGVREGYELDKRFLRPDGSLVHTRTNLRAVRLASGRVSMFLLLVEDISARYEAEARYRTMIEHAPEAIMLFAPRGGVIDCNENAMRLFRCSREDLLGKTILELSPQRQADGQLSAALDGRYLRDASAGQAPVFEWLHRDSAGRQVPCEVRLVRLPGDQELIRCSITDISERQRYQREIERLAYSDELTGLPNRRLLLDRLQHAMDRELREGSLGALLFIDLDHFKTVNDSLGHLVGDGLLREVTVRLAGSLRAEDTLARMGGDEFVVLLEGLDNDAQVAAEHAALTAEKLLESLKGSCWIDGHELSISASIGIALHPFGEQVAADVLKQADTAMYRAKHAGRNALHFFAPAMQAAIDQRLQLQGELRQSIQRGQLYLVFQPQLALDTGQVAGAEVLLRWLHPERGDIPPDQFIPLAEETGLIQDIGHWVLEQSCAALARWLPRYPKLVLAVNLSPRELRQEDCVARVHACLARYQLPHAALELEITEGVLLEDVELCIANMLALRASGIRFAIDDFGTGYSSLTYLKRLPLDRLKIDRSFIQDLDGDGSDLMLVQTILMIACNLGLECVAEGIETAQQFEVLRAHGCELGQGFHFGVPMREAAFLEWLGARS